MGSNHSTRKASFDANGEVDFDHFQILRAIGKGSFGKVCIIQKKDSKKMFAMKYMNKPLIIKKEAVRNVIREMEMLRTLQHPFIVNLWFTFQDEEDMFMVIDLLMGGDLRYHIQQDVKFDEGRVKLYICELALALDYLASHQILHRDIKPDNVLLDEGGHVHLTDFNIATVLKDGTVATSMSGTKPYMAPEVFGVALEQNPGYSFPFDWWSTGVCAYEMLKGRRPFDIHSNTPVSDVYQMFMKAGVHYPSAWEQGMKDLIKDLIKINPDHRLSTLEELKKHPYMQDVDFDQVYRKDTKPSFVPAKDHLNCDPTFELEEMIIEAKPLHKKKKRLAKNSKRNKQQADGKENQPPDPMQQSLDLINKEFIAYNREVELAEIEKHKQQQLEEASRPPPQKNDTTMKTETLQDMKNNTDPSAPKVEQAAPQEAAHGATIEATQESTPEKPTEVVANKDV